MQFLGAGASSRPQDSAQNGIKTRSGLVLNVAEQARPTMTMHPKQADLPAESDRSRSGMQDGATSYPSRWIGEGETGRGRVDDAWPEGRLYTENCENASEQRVSARRGTERCEIKVNSWECNTGTTGIGCRGDGMKDSCDGTGLEDAWPYCGRFHLAELKETLPESLAWAHGHMRSQHQQRKISRVQELREQEDAERSDLN